MKKLLSLVLVLVLALGSFSFATPADVVGTDYANAVDRLMALELLTGYPDGSFKPAATITRAEFAAVVVRALGLESAASVNSATKFSDVPATHWASGYISVASGLGVINGHTDGTFRPAAPVTYEQAVAMVVRALGYEPAVASKGGYPAGYLIIASENDLLDGVVGTVGAPAPRGLVSVLVDNALETPLMIQVGYGDEVKYVISGTDGTTEQTILENKLGLDVKESATVTSVDTDDREIKFQGDSTKYDVAAGVVLTTGLEYLTVTAWHKNDTVYAIDVESTVYYDFVDDTTTTALELVNSGVEVDVDAAVDVFVNGTEDATPFGTADEYNDYFGRVIINDDDEVTRAEFYSAFANAGIVTEITDAKLKFSDVSTAGGTVVTLLDMDDADFEWVIIDGKAATYTDLKAGMYFEYLENSDDEYVIVANTGKFEGKFTSIKNDLSEATIGGSTYDLAAAPILSNDKMDNYIVLNDADLTDDIDDTNVVAYKDNVGDVVVIVGDVEETTSSFYGFLKLANTFNEQVKVEKIVDGDIETVTYTYDLDVDDATVGSYTTDYNAGLGSEDFFEFVIDEDNVVIEINAVDGITDDNTQVIIDELDDDNNSILDMGGDRYFVENDVEIFSIDSVGGDPAEVDTLTWANMIGSDITTNTITINLPDGDNTPDVILVFNDANDELGTSTEDYMLAFAMDAPVLSAGKYKATVKTMDGDLAVVVDDSDIAAWENDFTALVLQKQSNGEYNVINLEEPDFITNSGLTALDTIYTDVDATMNNETITDIDGSYITTASGTYKIAADALVIRSIDDGDDFSVLDASALAEGDTVQFVQENNVIYMIFFER